MALKSWIDEIKTDENGQKSEAPLEPAGAPAVIFLPGEKEADQILFAALDQIKKDGVFHYSSETAAAEMDIDRTYKSIINGGHDFAALRAACGRWVEAARQAPDPPETISLFSGPEK